MTLFSRILRRLGADRHLTLVFERRWRELTVKIPVKNGTIGRNLVGSSPGWIGEVFMRLQRGHFNPSVIVDVGVNEGQTILEILAVFGGTVPVIGFEANPVLAAYTSEMLKLNGAENVSIIPAGLADRSAIVTLSGVTENDTAASIVADLRPNRAERVRQYVPVTSLDDVARSGIVSMPQNALVKIDVEGAELEVIRGARHTLETSRPLVLCEILWAAGPTRLEFMRSRNAELLSILRGVEYTPYRFTLDADATTVVGIESIEEFPSDIYIPAGQAFSNAHLCDYCLVPNEKVGFIEQSFGAAGLASLNPSSE